MKVEGTLRRTDLKGEYVTRSLESGKSIEEQLYLRYILQWSYEAIDTGLKL